MYYCPVRNACHYVASCYTGKMSLFYKHDSARLCSIEFQNADYVEKYTAPAMK